MSLDCLGAKTEIGFDFTEIVPGILQTAGGLTTGITSMVEKEQARQKAEADEKQAISAAVAADAAAAAAVAKAAVAAKLNSPSAQLDKTAAEIALSAVDRAGARLSPAGNEQRAQAANQARAAALAAAQAAPKDGYKAAVIDAWTQVINKAQAAAITAADRPQAPAVTSKPSWLTQKTGPVPNWGLAGAAVGLAALVARKLLH